LEDTRKGFPHFYNVENLGYFWGIAGQGFHIYTIKRIWTIFGRIAGQGFHNFTVKKIQTSFGAIAGQGFQTFTVKIIWTIFGRIATKVSTHLQ
jgi:hypothetical protein